METTRRTDEQGAAMVEFALVVIPLLILVVGALAFSLTLGLQQSTTHAASAAAREAAVVVAADDVSREAAILARATEVVEQQQSAWPAGAAPTVQTTFASGRVTVTVQTPNPFSSIGFLGLRPPASLTSTATIDLEDLG